MCLVYQYDDEDFSGDSDVNLFPNGIDNCPSWWELLGADMESFFTSHVRWFLYGGTLLGAAVAVVGAWKLGRACPVTVSEAVSATPAAVDGQGTEDPAGEDANEGEEAGAAGPEQIPAPGPGAPAPTPASRRQVGEG